MTAEMPIEIIFYILIGILYFAFWVMTFVILYHLTRFGVGVQPKKVAAAFLLGGVALFCASVFFVASLDLSKILS